MNIILFRRLLRILFKLFILVPTASSSIFLTSTAPATTTNHMTDSILIPIESCYIPPTQHIDTVLVPMYAIENLLLSFKDYILFIEESKRIQLKNHHL